MSDLRHCDFPGSNIEEYKLIGLIAVAEQIKAKLTMFSGYYIWFSDLVLDIFNVIILGEPEQ